MLDKDRSKTLVPDGSRPGGEKDSRIAAPSKGDIWHSFLAGDDPAEAFYRDQGGRSQFVVFIDQNGKIAGCDVVIASGIPTFDAMVCQVAR